MAISIIKQVTNNSDTGYCKMPDGTLIQWGSVNITTTTEKGPFGYTGQMQITYPIAFNSTPVTVGAIHDIAEYWNASVYNYNNLKATLSIAGNVSNVTKKVDWLAIGRWK